MEHGGYNDVVLLNFGQCLLMANLTQESGFCLFVPLSFFVQNTQQATETPLLALSCLGTADSSPPCENAPLRAFFIKSEKVLTHYCNM